MQETATQHGSIIYLEDVTVDYDGFKALQDLTFFMDFHELRVVIGPNGAGKTTLLDVISGKVRPSSGRVIFGKGTDLLRLREHDIVALGVARKFQSPTLFPQLSVSENLELSLRQERGVFATLWASLTATQHDTLASWTRSAWHTKRRRRRLPSPTAKSNGWRSGWSWRKTRSSC
jgi:urea transport system ATP-binding protein